jgi:two-component system cell cycle response regulator
MTEKEILSKLDSTRDLLTLPQVLKEVLRVVDKKDSSVSDIGKIIIQDVALTAKILRMANSAFYGRMYEISTVNQAIVILGLRAVKALALSTSIFDIVNNKNLKPVFDQKLFWRHSLEVAVCSRMIAEEINYQPAEEAFVAGLLHDLGLIFLGNQFPKEYEQIWKRIAQGEDICKLEQEVLGTNHSAVGRYIAENWNLPNNIKIALANHHNTPEHGKIEENNVLWKIVALANLISKNALENANDYKVEDFASKDAFLQALKLSANSFHKIFSTVGDEVVKAAEYLEVEIGNPLELLQKANQDLYKIYLTVERLLKENQEMQAKLIEEEKKRTALESLHTILATFSHYINNATTTIMGRAQLVDLAIKKGEVKDPQGNLTSSMKVIQQGVETISIVLDELKELTSFDTVKYHDKSNIIDIGERVKMRIGKN